MRASFPTSNMLAPAKGPQCIPQTFDFSTATSVTGDFEQEYANGTIDYIQAMYVDNSANVNAVTFIFGGTQQKVIVPAGAQGMWPVISIMPLTYKISTPAAGGLLIAVTWLNFPVPYTAWGPVTVNAALNPVVANFTDRSGSIALGGTSQQLVAANGARKRIVIENPATLTGQNIAAAESLFINFGGVAAGINNGTSIELLPGGSFDSNFGPVDATQWTVNAATTGHRYICKES